MIESVIGMSGLFVDPWGSNRIPLNRFTASSTGSPYWSAIENARQNA